MRWLVLVVAAGCVQPAAPLAAPALGNQPVGWWCFRPTDITTGLLGTNTWSVVGYTPDTCQRLLENTIGWAKWRVAGKGE